MTKRRAPARTVKGQDIELHASDGQRVDTRAQMPFTRAQPEPKPGTLGALMAKSPFARAAKALRD